MISTELGSVELKELLREANFRQAREYVRAIDFGMVIAVTPLEITDGRGSEKAMQQLMAALQLRSMSAEVYDYWGDFDRSRSLSAPSRDDCEQELKRHLDQRFRALTDIERLLLRQRVWILLQAGMSEYRFGNLSEAEHLFELCRRVAEEQLRSSKNEAWGTRARIHYSLGLVFRERFAYDSAFQQFTLSAEYAFRSLEGHRAAKNEESLVEKERWTERLIYLSVAKSLALGLAYIHSESGRPALAAPLLASASCILHSLGERLVSAYVDLVFALVLRRRGEDRLDDQENQMKDVIKRVEKCRRVFAEEGHSYYQALATYQLAVSYHQSARPDESVPLSETGRRSLEAARECLRDLRAISEQDDRFLVRKLTLESHIYRKMERFEQAEQTADLAVSRTRVGEAYVYPLIARGQARACNRNISDAISDFRLASEKTKNPRMEAACYLHLCRLYATNSNQSEAKRYFEKFSEIRPLIDNTQIRILESQAQAAMSQAGKDFVLRMSEKGITAEWAEKRLREFLIAWARSQARTEAEAARALGISRQTLHNWSQSKTDD